MHPDKAFQLLIVTINKLYGLPPERELITILFFRKGSISRYFRKGGVGRYYFGIFGAHVTWLECPGRPYP